jgi:hypothetical protein
MVVSATPALAASTNGSGGQMPALFNGQPVTINLKDLPPDAAQAVLANNKSINKIFMSDATLPGGQMFVSVINAIQGQGPGFNPLWQEFHITFNNPAFPPQQLVSEAQITQAAAAGQITVTPTTMVDRCAVVGPTP